MDQGRPITRICLCLVAIVLITAPHGVISLPCAGPASSGQTENTSEKRATDGARSSSNLLAPAVAAPTQATIKKDLFMSRGWGASGMPFSMFYLNHYAKAQKAYAQSQLQLQQLQNRQLQQQQLQLQLQQAQSPQKVQRIPQEQLAVRGPSASDSSRSETTDWKSAQQQPLQPKANSAGARYEPELVAVHAQQLRTDTDYTDSAPAMRTTSKVNTTRRQYTVPQLFVSYGWGPIG